MLCYIMNDMMSVQRYKQGQEDSVMTGSLGQYCQNRESQSAAWVVVD